MTRLLQASRRRAVLKNARTRQKQKGPKCSLWVLVSIGLCCSGGLVFILYRRVNLSLLHSRGTQGETSLLSTAHDNVQKQQAPLIPQPQIRSTSLQNQPPSQKVATTSQSFYQYAHDKFGSLKAPWTVWSQCDLDTAFQQKCHPRPATCRADVNDIYNTHGIGNAITISYVKEAAKSLTEQPDCAPILRDKVGPRANNPQIFKFQFLDYMQEPTVVVPTRSPPQGYETSEAIKTCITYSITQPRQAVASKVQEIRSKWKDNLHFLPLVALHLRTGWSDELKNNAQAWEALGDCSDFTVWNIDMVPNTVSEANLKGIVLDVAHAADELFGAKQWRFFVASDGPGVRRYVQHILQDRVAGPIVWNEGKVGHNFQGRQTTTFEERVEVSISAFTDVIVMSEADFLVSLTSKFPRAATMRRPCPQLTIQLGGHPRHGLAKSGSLLNIEMKKRVQQTKDGIWYPDFDAVTTDRFWEGLPQGKENPCAKMDNPLRSCYCMLKLGHAE